MRHATSAVIAALLVFPASLSAAAPSPEPVGIGKTDPVGGGKAILSLGSRFSTKLANSGIAVSGVLGGDVQRQRTVRVRVVGGVMDPVFGRGTIEMSGGFRLSRGKRSVKISAFHVETESGFVRARIGGLETMFGSLDSVSDTRRGFGVRIRAERLELAGAAATQINQKLALRGKSGINAGGTLGSLELLVQPRRVTIALGEVDFTPGGADTLAKLASKGVPPLTSFSAAFPASRRDMTETPGFYLHFGVYYGGSILRDGSAGTLGLSGGMEVKKAGGSAVLFANFRFRFQDGTMLADIYVNGVKMARNSPIADGIPLPMPIGRERAFRIAAGPVKMVEETATLLNREFPGGEAFAAGDSLGTFTLLANGQ